MRLIRVESVGVALEPFEGDSEESLKGRGVEVAYILLSIQLFQRKRGTTEVDGRNGEFC